MSRTSHAALTLAVALATGLGLTGCGNGKLAVPDLASSAAPAADQTLHFPADGLRLRVPADWTVSRETAPLIGVISSGPATIALWRYRRQRPAITGTGRLHAALARLEAAARAEDPSLRIKATGLTSVDGAGATIIDAIETINGHRRRVRSEHVYADGAEIVLEAYAPPDQFASDDHLVFSPVRKSLTLTAVVAEGHSGTTTTASTTVGGA